MKKAYYIFKEYYLTYIVLNVIIIFLFYFFCNYEADVDRANFMAVFMSIFMVFIPTAEYLSHTYYRPWKIKKMLKLSPFFEFIRNGFIENEESNVLIGEIEDYTIIIGIDWPNYLKKSIIFYQILFNPFKKGQYIQEKEYDNYHNILRKNEQLITLNSIIKQYYKNNFFTDFAYNAIKKDIKVGITFLKENKLEEISQEAWEDLIPEMERFSRSLQKV